jgi:acyl-CoA thioesterase FadM
MTTDRCGTRYAADAGPRQFDYDVVRLADDTLAAVGHTVHAAVDAGGKPCRLPQTLKDMLK